MRAVHAVPVVIVAVVAIAACIVLIQDDGHGENSISYATNGGTLPDGTATSYTEGQVMDLPVPVRDGHAFTGWYLEPGLRTLVTDTSGLSGDVVLYAGWEPGDGSAIPSVPEDDDTPPMFSIAYEPDGGTMPEGSFSMYMLGQDRPLPVPVKDGYDFVGWYLEPELLNRVEGTSHLRGSVTLYAAWTVASHDITYMLNGGHFEEEPVTSYTEGTTVFLTEPVRDGYIFGGWFLDDEFTEPVVTVGDDNDDVTVHAAWVDPDRSGTVLVERLHYGTDYERTTRYIWYDEGRSFVEEKTIIIDSGEVHQTTAGWIRGMTVGDGHVFIGTETVDGYPCTVWDTGDSVLYLHMMTTVVKKVHQNGTGYWEELVDMMEPEYGEPVTTDIRSWYPIVVSGDIGSYVGDRITLTAEGDGFDGWYLDGHRVSEEKSITFRLHPDLTVEARSSADPVILHDDITLGSLGFGDSDVFDPDGVPVEDMDGLEPGEYTAVRESGGVTYLLRFEPDHTRAFEHTWTYGGEEYSISSEIRYSDIRDYVDNHPYGDDRNPKDPDHYAVYHTVDDPVVRDIALQLLSLSVGSDRYTTADLILGFVQSLPYESDHSLYGAPFYCAYPLEVLWNHGGDIMDKTVLCTTLMSVAGFDACLGYDRLQYSYYTLVALELDDGTGLEHLEADGSRYYVCALYDGAGGVGEIDDWGFDIGNLGILLDCPATGFSDGFVFLGYETYGGTLPDDAPAFLPAGTDEGLPIPVLDGHAFMGWCLDDGFTEMADGISGLRGAVVLHASWDPAVYSVSYELHGGVPEGDLPVLFSQGAVIELPPATRDGYRFTGWRLGSEQGPVVASTSDLDGHSTLHAGWEIVEYTVSYILDGGSFDSEPPAAYTTLDTLTLPEPSRDGYVFGGWFLDAGFTEPVVVIPSGSHGDVAVHAAWVTGYEPGTVLTWYGQTSLGSFAAYSEVRRSYVMESDGMLLMQETARFENYYDGIILPMTTETGWTAFDSVVGDGWEFRTTATVNGYPCTVWRDGRDTYWVHMMTLVVRYEDSHLMTMNLVDIQTSADGESMVLEVAADSALTVSGPVEGVVGGDATFSVEGDGFTGWYLNGLPLGTDRTVTLEDINPAMVLEARAGDDVLNIQSLDDLPEGWGVGEAEFIDWSGYPVTDMSQAGLGEYQSIRTSDGIDYTLRFFLDEVHTFDHTWTYGGEEYRLSIDVRYSDFFHDRQWLTGSDNDMPVFGRYCTVDDPVIVEVGRMLHEMYPGDDRNGFADFLLRFVQSIPYTTEHGDGDGEYWMLPVEYLWYGAGDCEDSSIFLTVLMAVCGYDSMFLLFMDHAMSSVSIDMADDAGMVHVTGEDGTKYYFCETTGGEDGIGTTWSYYYPENLWDCYALEGLDPSPVTGPRDA